MHGIRMAATIRGMNEIGTVSAVENNDKFEILEVFEEHNIKLKELVST